MKSINKIQFKNNSLVAWSLFALIALFSFSACEKDMEGQVYQVSDEKMMDEILESNANLSSFLKIIDISNFRGTVHAYGTYTLFAPTNDAVERYLAAEGKDLNSLSQEEAAKIVGYHLITDTVPTADFVDGRLGAPNFNNQYITTKTVSVSGSVTVEVNRQALLIQKDLRGSNGIVQVIDNVLSHSTKTIDQTIRELPDTYSLWKEMYNKIMKNNTALDDVSFKYTVFIQDDDAFASAGIHNMDDLMTELRAKSPAVEDDEQLLDNYLRYHSVGGLNYVTDLMIQTSLNTMVKDQPIVLKRNLDQVILNEFVIGGILEPGVPVNRKTDYTDLSCSNGVIHSINGNIQVVNRSAYRVYWDIAEQPEIMALKGFRKSGTSVGFDKGELANVTWGNKNTGNKFTYYCGGYPTTVDKNNNYTYGDRISWRFDLNTNNWAEFKTPVLVPGTYKLWFAFRASSDTQQMRTIFKQDGEDDQILGVTTLAYNKSPGSYNLTNYDNEFYQKALLDGYRYHMAAAKPGGTGFFHDTAVNCQSLGVLVVSKTGQHTLRLEPLVSRWDTSWDMFLFIPIDEDQIWPQQDITGKWIYENTPVCEVYPYTTCTTPDPDPEE